MINTNDEDDRENELKMSFKEYSDVLDKKNDKHERIYKTNRDVTVKSKKIIFNLHQIIGLSDEEKTKCLQGASNDMKDVEQTLLKHIAMELRDEEPFQFINAYTGALQEYIEAVAFLHFLQTGEIISHSQIQERVIFGPNEEKFDEVVPLGINVPAKEYILGLADLTGELMRYCIKSVSIGDFEMCYTICDILKQMNGGFQSLGYIPSKELYHKVNVFRSSLHKVEEACYSLQLRKSELPPDMLSDIFMCKNPDEPDMPFLYN